MVGSIDIGTGSIVHWDIAEAPLPVFRVATTCSSSLCISSLSLGIALIVDCGPFVDNLWNTLKADTWRALSESSSASNPAVTGALVTADVGPLVVASTTSSSSRGSTVRRDDHGPFAASRSVGCKPRNEKRSYTNNHFIRMQYHKSTGAITRLPHAHSDQMRGSRGRAASGGSPSSPRRPTC